MSQEITAQIKVQIPAGKATPAPPVGTALGPHGINIQEFCTKFNEATKQQAGDVIPVELTIYKDRSFDFILKTPPASLLIAKAAKIKKGASNPLTETVGSITQDQLKVIAEQKMPDLSANTIEAAMKTIAGTARQMGVKIK